MSRDTLATATLAAVALSLPLSAQITVSATGALNASHSTAQSIGGSQSLPAGSVLANNSGVGSGAASSIYTLDNTSARCAFSLTSSAPSMTSTNGSPNWWSRTAADGTANVTLRSAQPIDVDIEISIARESAFSCRTVNSSVSSPLGTWSTSGQCLVDPNNIASVFGFPCSFQTSATIDANGLSFALTADASGAYSFTSQCGASGGATARVAVIVTPRSAAVEYGQSCGLTLGATADLSAPGVETLRIADSNPLPIGVLIVGTGQIALAMPWGCDLHTNPIVSVPLNLDPQGEASIPIRRPNLGVFTLQAGTLDATTVRMSNGLAF